MLYIEKRFCAGIDSERRESRQWCRLSTLPHHGNEQVHIVFVSRRSLANMWLIAKAAVSISYSHHVRYVESKLQSVS